MLINLRHQGVKYTYTVPEKSGQYCWVDPAGKQVNNELSLLLLQKAEETGIDLSLFNNYAVGNMKKFIKKTKVVRAPVKLFGKDGELKGEVKTAIKLF